MFYWAADRHIVCRSRRQYTLTEAANSSTSSASAQCKPAPKGHIFKSQKQCKTPPAQPSVVYRASTPVPPGGGKTHVLCHPSASSHHKLHSDHIWLRRSTLLEESELASLEELLEDQLVSLEELFEDGLVVRGAAHGVGGHGGLASPCQVLLGFPTILFERKPSEEEKSFLNNIDIISTGNMAWSNSSDCTTG